MWGWGKVDEPRSLSLRQSVGGYHAYSWSSKLVGSSLSPGRNSKRLRSAGV
jgi:hypothetical protein